MNSSKWIGLGALSIAVLASLGAQRVQPELEAPHQNAGLNAHETHASASLLGQFRTNLSAWLWLRADLYLHNGVEMRPLTEQEVSAGKRGVGSSDNHENELHDDSKITTVIPSAEHDFRGIFGDIERETKTYKDMRGHDHNSPRESLPLFRLMTWVDPQFIPAWTVGANILCWDKDPMGVAKAVAYLNEGISHNPKSIALQNEMGSVLLRKAKDMDASVPYFTAAIALKPRDAKLLEEEESDALQQSYRWLALVHREQGNLAEQLRIAREGLAQFPQDRVLWRLSHPIPKVLSPSAYELELKRHKEIDLAAEAAAREDTHDHDHDHDHGHGHDHEH
ncbi:MAG: hypothetical protein JNM85_08120 [Chthonomonas sp.]|nr:hypothetical protein [Chthonomonas sp.]